MVDIHGVRNKMSFLRAFFDTILDLEDEQKVAFLLKYQKDCAAVVREIDGMLSDEGGKKGGNRS